MKEIKYEDLKVGMKVKLKPLEKCILSGVMDPKITNSMRPYFGNVSTISALIDGYPDWFFIPNGIGHQYYDVSWIESIVDEEPTGVINPNHYTKGGIECIEAIKAATIGKRGIEAVCVANVIKYLWRYEDKGAIVDVQKAQWYIEKLIQEISD
jgi:hypothetical protein